ncbi:hypothetical protein HY572_02960 [Candidatus Micrarchaeota archaeon]|nr:hypothetical protein [Candidatus Micrarchaeota archaeon]
MDHLASSIRGKLSDLGLFRSPNSSNPARGGTLALLSKHHLAIQEAGGPFQLNNDLRRNLRDRGVVLTEESGQTYLYLHGLSLLKGASFKEARTDFLSNALRLKELLAASGLEAHVHASTYRTTEENELSSLMGRHFDGFWKALTRYARHFTGVHSLVLRVQVPSESAPALEQALRSWRDTASLKNRQRDLGLHTLLSCLVSTPTRVSERRGDVHVQVTPRRRRFRRRGASA